MTLVNNLDTHTQIEYNQALDKDIESIYLLIKKVYSKNLEPYSLDTITKLIENPFAVNIVARLNGKVVGFLSSIPLNERRILINHSWKDISTNATGLKCDPDSPYLYGIELAVDPRYVRNGIAKNLYKRREEIAKALDYDGIYIVGRVPGIKEVFNEYENVEHYVKDIISKDKVDRVLSFQLAQEFNFIKVIDDYLPCDEDSHGHGILLFKKIYLGE